MKYWELFKGEWSGYAGYFFQEVIQPHWGNYFYWLIAISVAVYGLELIWPWRKNQAPLRRDFWQDAFYLFFNFFLFSLIGYHALSTVFSQGFVDLLGLFGITHLVALEIGSWPHWLQLLVMFLLRDFIQFNIHRLLHRVPVLWEFHKVHHSVLEMGFAAHLRFHWMENVVYRSLEYLPLAMIGFGLQDFILVHLFALTIGHLNHANFKLPMGPLRYIFNNAPMHIWHHVKAFPASHPSGVNFGISLSIWDYLFGTAYIPESGRDIELGFEGVEYFPRKFLVQAGYPFLGNEKGA